MRSWSILVVPSLLIGCNAPGEGVPVLGGGRHDVDRVDLDVIATAADSLEGVRDLAFHPTEPDELWVVNQDSQSTTIFTDVGRSSQQAMHVRDGSSGPHFHARPSALAMGQATFATIHDTDELTQGPDGTPPDFMGPTLWPADKELFDAGHGSHLDMLHNSPLGKGIAWAGGNAFWVFDGYHRSLTRYAFGGDHGMGGADHSDGVAKRYATDEVAPDVDLPAHLELAPSGLLYVADTGNGRVAVLDTNTLDGTGPSVGPNYDGGRQEEIGGGDLQTLTTEELTSPSGLAIQGDLVFVSDPSQGRILAFSMDDGALVDWLDVGGEPNGLAFHEDGSLFFVDHAVDEIVRLSGR